MYFQNSDLPYFIHFSACCFGSLTIVHSQDTFIPNHLSISTSNFVVSFKNFNTNHIMTYLDFLLYVRITPDFLALLSFVEFLGLVASLACMRSSASAMVDGSRLIPEMLLFAFYPIKSGVSCLILCIFAALEVCSRVDGGRNWGEAEFVQLEECWWTEV